VKTEIENTTRQRGGCIAVPVPAVGAPFGVGIEGRVGARGSEAQCAQAAVSLRVGPNSCKQLEQIASSHSLRFTCCVRSFLYYHFNEF